MKVNGTAVMGNNNLSKTATLEAAIPWLYLKGVSTG